MSPSKKNPKVLVVLGSKSDEQYLAKAIEIFENLGIPYEAHFCSAHREPKRLEKILDESQKLGVKVIIAAAGLAAHLPGVVASKTKLPVIGVPIPAGTLGGLDALLSIVQMPKGVPVATVGIGRMDNAAILAAQILALSDNAIAKKLADFKL